MGDLQDVVDFVMTNRAFFAFVAALAGYIASKIRSAGREERIGRQRAALEGVARAVEDFQQRLNRREPLAIEDPKALKKEIAYRVSTGREELDEAIASRARRQGQPAARGMKALAMAAARALLP